MKPKIYWLILLTLILLIASCVAVITTSPKKQSFNQRLESFPTKNLPLQKPAMIYWNDYLIPFIEAQSDQDCAFLIGMVQAHLRLAQMTLFKRVVQGRLSESAGPIATSIDQTLRIVNFGAAADRIEKTLPKETKDWLQNFVNGINFYQQQMQPKPIEFKLLNIEPEPWTVKDIITMGRLASADVNWFNWFQWFKLRDKPYWQELWHKFVDIGFHSTPSFDVNPTPFSSMISSGIKSGSNAIVVSASHSADSSAILASDPHLGLQLPNIWLIAGYRCPSYHVVGLMLPGVPMILLGRNHSIAWGGTNMRSASSDLYELSTGQSNHFTTQKEKISVRWWFDKEIEVRSSELGPLISDASFFKTKEEKILALKWAGYQVTDEYTAFLELNRAQNWSEFRNAFETYAVSGQNFLYADTAGHIGMVLAVQIPIRSPDRPAELILNPDNPQHQWQGLMKSPELPAVFDPDAGFIVSANNRPVVTNPPLGYFFSANDRADRLITLLQKKERIDWEYLQSVQQDVFVPSAITVRNLLLEKIEQLNLHDEKTESLINRLRQWDGQYKTQSQGAVVFQLILFHFIQNYYNRIYDADVVELLLSSEHVNSFLNELLESSEPTESSKILKESLEIALTKTNKEYKKFANWGELHRLKLAHPLARIPLIGGRFRFGDYPAEGSYNSLMKTAHQISNRRHETFYGANARIIIRMKEADENYFVLLGGQDGWLGSDNLIDQVPLWRNGQYIKVPLRLKNIQNEFPYRTVLTIR